MKKTALLMFLSMQLFFAGAESGAWVLTPFQTRLPGPVLILPEKAYSRPYRGIEEIRFIDDYLLILSCQGEEHRAFYEFVPGNAADNRSLKLTFRSGKVLTIYLAENGPGESRFEYRLAPDFFRTLYDDNVPGSSGPAEPPGSVPDPVPAAVPAEGDPLLDGAVQDPAGEDWVFTGTMRTKSSAGN